MIQLPRAPMRRGPEDSKKRCFAPMRRERRRLANRGRTLRRVRPFSLRPALSDGVQAPSATIRRVCKLGILVFAALVVAGCGSSHKTVAPPAGTTTAPAPTTTASGPSPLTPEAQAAATGDIPDNQVFLRFRNAAAGYSIEYPEGWAQQGSGPHVTFRDKNNIVRIEVARGSPPTPATVRHDVGGVSGAHMTSAPLSLTISGRPALKVVYTTESAPNAVTGKRVTLIVDRYYLWRNGTRAVIDLGTPQGVDNVDAYRLMSESFRWR